MENTTVVLFSGGLDSLACYYWAVDQRRREKPYSSTIVGLYVDLATPYSQVEMGVARDMCKSLGIKLNIVPMRFMGELSDKVGHVPLRNIFLLEIAALYGNKVMFGMLHGELSEDKGFPFLRRMQGLFDTQTIKNLYHDESKIKLYAPFGNKTKTDVVRFLLTHNVTSQQLRKTVGCLRGTVCGECPPCFNRWMAFENNTLFDIDKYPQDIHPAIWGLQEMKASRSGNKNMFKRSLLSIPLWEKRKWIRDVWKAYKSAYNRGVILENPRMVLKQIIGV